jgi:hypothetical protein
MRDGLRRAVKAGGRAPVIDFRPSPERLTLTGEMEEAGATSAR